MNIQLRDPPEPVNTPSDISISGVYIYSGNLNLDPIFRAVEKNYYDFMEGGIDWAVWDYNRVTINNSGTFTTSNTII